MYVFKSLKRVAVVLSALFAVGCATVDTAPFEKFSASMEALDKGSTASLNINIDMSEKRHKRQLIEELTDKNKHNVEKLKVLEKLLVEAGDDPFHISASPLFVEAETFKSGISRANQVWVDYSKMLLKLASTEIDKDDNFDSMANKLNAASIDAMRSLKQNTVSIDAENSAIFSTIVMTAAKAFIENKKKDDLVKVINGSQGSIDLYTKSLKTAIIHMAQLSTQEHTEAQKAVLDKMATLIPAGGDEKTLLAEIEKMIALKKQHAAQMLSLKSLHQAYDKIPSAHQSLAKNIVDGEISLSEINTLLEKGIAMYSSYESRLAENEASLIQAKALAANAIASTAELEFQQMSLEYSQANLKYTEALSDSTQNPGDVTKKSKADTLKEGIDELKEKLDLAEEKAKSLREAARAVQTSANTLKQTITAK